MKLLLSRKDTMLCKKKLNFVWLKKIKIIGLTHPLVNENQNLKKVVGRIKKANELLKLLKSVNEKLVTKLCNIEIT